mgnify:CR=1 FL=1
MLLTPKDIFFFFIIDLILVIKKSPLNFPGLNNTIVMAYFMFLHLRPRRKPINKINVVPSIIMK